jgi:NAD(P)-dependent dehydrogenase (short-subunit alcohol dehydrogenase family)
MGESRGDLSGQVVVVAGASSGMGRATALALGAAGARVVLASRRAAALEEVRATIAGKGGVARAVPADCRDPSAVRHLLEAALDMTGRIDALINAVGTNIRERALDQLTPATWSGMMEANLTTAYYLTHEVAPIFRRQGGGLLVHISSGAAKKPDRSGVAYQAVKAGVASLAHGAMEEERANGLRVTVIFPGLTDTPLILQRPEPTPPEVLARALQPEDVAAACLFVLSLPPRAYVPELVLAPSRL